MNKTSVLLNMTALAVFLAECSTKPSGKPETPPPNVGPVLEEQLSTAELSRLFSGLTPGTSLKNYTGHNPLMTHDFGADPWAMVYNDRVYLYLTGDRLQYRDGTLMAETYGLIRHLRVFSSADLVNWTDHGDIKIGGEDGLAPWANNGNGNAWAPAAAYKIIDGSAKFFLYWADSSRGIGVLTANSPTGPWTDPLKGYLISRDTPTCSEAEVVWLFDPAVLVDDNGDAYLYFGGGTDGKPAADPGTGRVVKLGSNMISLAEDPVPLTIPYLFEDSGINKIGDTYYYSYCTNWGTGGNNLGISASQIAYMTSTNPKGPFSFRSKILDAPRSMFSGTYGENNHHSMFEFKGSWYMAYHTETLEKLMKEAGEMPAQLPHPTTGALQADSRYRNPHIDAVTINPDGSIAQINGTMTGVAQVGHLDPYRATEASTIGIMAGINVKEDTAAKSKTTVTEINSGDWIALYGVDFGSAGAKKFFCRVKAPQTGLGAIQLRLDSVDGPAAAYASIKLAEGETGGAYSELTVDLPRPLTGVHDLIFVFYGEGWEFDMWKFLQ
ncbi:MAG: family 43 glycosylhydrolase [Treponema sp.]|jgi:arabinoxylan arabinofuranohydrolase|nr:family 43 glycosylhydrolase [Treponema sp.]